MVTVEEVVNWVERDLALLPAKQAIEGRKLLVTPRLINLDHDGKQGDGVVVARNGDRVAYFDDFNDEFAIGDLEDGTVKLVGLYGDFRYAIQALINDEKSVL